MTITCSIIIEHFTRSLVSSIFPKLHRGRDLKCIFGFYAILLKDVKCGDLVYGRDTYDYQEGTLVFLSPGQTAGINSNNEVYQPKGYGLVFTQICSMARHLDDISRITHSSITFRMNLFICLIVKERLFSTVLKKSNMNWNMRSISIVNNSSSLT